MGLLFGIVSVLLLVTAGILLFRWIINPVTTEVKVTNKTVRRQLEAVSELVTEKYTYTGFTTITSSRKLFDVEMPGTSHSIHVLYMGVIKIGFDFSNIGLTVDDRTNRIQVVLPDPMVTDNYIDVDSIKCIYDNNLFNPIDENEVNTYLSSVKVEEEKRAKEADIFVKAKEEAKKQIIKFLSSVFEDYEISVR